MSIQDLESLSVAGTRVSKTAESDLTIDDICDVIGSERRRWTLHALASADGEMKFPELVNRVAEMEFGRPERSISSKERMRVYSALKQSHLPKMRERGAVEFDDISSTSEIRIGKHADEICSGIVALQSSSEKEETSTMQLLAEHVLSVARYTLKEIRQ